MNACDKKPNTATESLSARAVNDATERDTQAEEQPVEYEAEYPVYLGLLQDLPAVARYDPGEDELRNMPAGNQDSGWQNCLNSVDRYDRELCQAYREQIDTLLVFAGLFSAVVTAFVVESYQWLQDDPMDTSMLLLREVVSLLSQTANLTAPSIPDPAHRLSGAAIVRINSFWFISLTLSLSAALVGILCKQWLREFEQNVGQSPEMALAVRHIRFQGFEYWKVGSIVTSVPIIMQMALACFIIGIIDLLWQLHVLVACFVTAVAGLTLAFYSATTLLPVMQYVYICMRCYVKPLRTRDYPFVHAFTEPQCAFKSAQAWIAFRVARPLINRILTAYGYEFSSHHPPAVVDTVLRNSDSWVAFDLNWVKCRENIHVGPRCASESLTWIAMNLGEIHMNAWIWHCIWARWLNSRESPNDLIRATKEIESVARSYPRIVSLGDNNTTLVRSQAMIFRCSLRPDIPVQTAIELLLRVARAAGVNSLWTSEALHAIRVVYRGVAIRLNDDIAISLFRLAETQTSDILFKPDGPNSATQYNGALAFRDIVAILHRGTPLRDILISAMSGLVLQWLRSRPPMLVARVARAVFEDILWYLVSQGYRGAGLRGLRRYRGIMFIAKLAGAVVEQWPEEPHMDGHSPDERAVLWELLAILSDGFPELCREHSSGMKQAHLAPGAVGEGSNAPVSDAPGGAHAREEVHAELHDILSHTEQHLDLSGSADGERSDAPVTDALVGAHGREETYTEPHDQLAHTRRVSRPSSPEYLCIDVHGDAEQDAVITDVDKKDPTSLMASPVTSSSPLHSRTSLSTLTPSSG